MKQFQLLVLSALLAANGAWAETAPSNDAVTARASASRAAVKIFAERLQGELKTALTSSGPVSAIAVCSEQAPAIATAVSSEQGWSVARTSLKPRNPDNAPDAWEQAVLQSFEQRKAAGEEPARLEFFEVVGSGAAREFRYMKAIGIGKDTPCLTCHGTDLAPEVAAKLKTLYPQDQATGYSSGDLRGAFTIRQPM